MDKRKGFLNISLSVTFKFLLCFAAIFVRRIVIRSLGNELNGLNSLYLSIMDVLCVAELGVGQAITYCMYEPIVNGDTRQTSALYSFFKSTYRKIGAIVLLLGLVLTAWIPYLAKDYGTLDVDIRFTFFLMLLSTCITYCYGAKSALIEAHKNNYITSAIGFAGKLSQYILQILALLLTRSFAWFLASRILANFLQWGLTSAVVDRVYREIITEKNTVLPDTRVKIGKNIRAMFLHKIGAIVVGATDSILISAFVGIVVLGKYSNYTTIMTSMTGVLGLLFISLTSVVGHMCVEASPGEIAEHYDFFYGVNFCIAILFFGGYYATINCLITFLFGEGLLLSRSVIFIMTVSYFIQFTRRATLLFRDATGLFYADRWKSAVEALVNLVASVALVNRLGVSGVLIGTIITNVLICDVIEPYVLYKNALHKSVKPFWVRNYGYILLFVLELRLLDSFLMEQISVKALLWNAFISIILGVVTCLVIFSTNKPFRQGILKGSLAKKRHK